MLPRPFKGEHLSAAEGLQRLGGADVSLATAPSARSRIDVFVRAQLACQRFLVAPKARLRAR